MLSGFCRVRRCTATLYFDGAPLDGWRGTTILGPVRVLHSGGRRSADDAILSMIAARRSQGSLRVVTSDRSLSDRCRHLGAATATVREFRAALSEAAIRAERGAEKPERVDPAEVAWYMELFGADDSPGPPSDPKSER